MTIIAPVGQLHSQSPVTTIVHDNDNNTNNNNNTTGSVSAIRERAIPSFVFEREYNNNENNNNNNNKKSRTTMAGSGDDGDAAAFDRANPVTWAALALDLTLQNWHNLGLDSLNADGSSRSKPPQGASTNFVMNTTPSADVLVLTRRVTALLLMRCVAVAATPQQAKQLYHHHWSTTHICRVIIQHRPAAMRNVSANALLMEEESQRDGNSENNMSCWPAKITVQVVDQMLEFVRRMLAGYKDVPYHNRQHAFHVCLSMNKLLDMMLESKQPPGPGPAGQMPSTTPLKNGPPVKTFGLRYDPVALLGLLYAALIHDVEHQGIPNRQLAVEDDRLAVLYNDQSIAENWSLYVAFSDFLQDEFSAVRALLFPSGEEYRRFRKMVITLVLATDIASPERTQLTKSKWKEAFGDPYETMERKMMYNRTSQTGASGADGRRNSMMGKSVQISGLPQPGSPVGKRLSRRGTGDVSELSIEEARGLGSSTDVFAEEEGDDSPSVTPEGSVRGDDDDDPLLGQQKQKNGGGVGSGQLAFENRTNALLFNNSSHHSNSRFDRRMSANSRNTATSKYRKRLGILRAVDLSGETLEAYAPRRGSIGYSGRSDGTDDVNAGAGVSMTHVTDDPKALQESMETWQLTYDDEPNELKATVVMETLMTAADVAHNLQGWRHMVLWSGRLYLELRKAFTAGRAGTMDPQQRWFENQIGFLESYLLPLARKLEDTGVFGDRAFASTLESNRDKWLTEGYDESQKIIVEGSKQYPLNPK